MHIPDGYLDPWLCALFYLLTFTVLGYSAHKARDELDEKTVPLIGVTAAGVFAAQMLNWPIPGGTSAHFVGGALAGIILGPFVGSLSMASVVTIQALMFGDGGILALGANIWNMAIIDVFLGYFGYRVLRDYNSSIASFFGGWFGITLGALFVGLQLGASSIFNYRIGTTVSVMVIGHALLGLIEAGITMSAYRYIVDLRPDLLRTKSKKEVEV